MKGVFFMFDLTPFDRRGRNLSRYFDNMERSLWNDMESAFSDFRMDIRDEGDHYLLEAELPGFEKKDIRLDVEGDTLTIRAERDQKEEVKKHHYLHQERCYGCYARSVDLSNVKAEEIKAAYQNGVLTLTLPKRTAQKPESRRIDIQ